MTDPADLTLVDLLPLLEQRALSARELLDACLARVERARAAGRGVRRAHAGARPRRRRAGRRRPGRRPPDRAARRGAGRAQGPLPDARACRRPPRAGCSRATTRGSTRRSGSGCATPARACSARRRCTSSPTAPARTRRATRGTSRRTPGRLVRRLGARPWPPGWCRSRPAPTPAAPCASRPPPAACASLRPTLRAGVDVRRRCRCRARSTPPARWRGACATSACCCACSPGTTRATPARSTSRCPPTRTPARTDLARRADRHRPPLVLGRRRPRRRRRPAASALDRLVARGAELVEVDPPADTERVLAFPGAYGALHGTRGARAPRRRGSPSASTCTARRSCTASPQAREITPEQHAQARPRPRRAGAQSWRALVAAAPARRARPPDAARAARRVQPDEGRGAGRVAADHPRLVGHRLPGAVGAGRTRRAGPARRPRAGRTAGAGGRPRRAGHRRSTRTSSCGSSPRLTQPAGRAWHRLRTWTPPPQAAGAPSSTRATSRRSPPGSPSLRGRRAGTTARTSPGWLLHEQRAVSLDGVGPDPDTATLHPGRPRSTATVVGAARLELPRRDNLHLCELDLSPSHRRPGAGASAGRWWRRSSASPASTGARRCSASPTSRPAQEGRSGNRAAAQALGYDVVQQEVRRDIDLPLPAERVAELERTCRPHAADYAARDLARRQPGRAASTTWPSCTGRCRPTCPKDEMDWREEVWDAARRAAQRAAVARTWTARGSAPARCTCRPAVLSPSPAWAGRGPSRRGPTSGRRSSRGRHRGHRLGMLVKLAGLQELAARSPRTRFISTWNAQENAPMIAVNDAARRPDERSPARSCRRCSPLLDRADVRDAADLGRRRPARRGGAGRARRGTSPSAPSRRRPRPAGPAARRRTARRTGRRTPAPWS